MAKSDNQLRRERILDAAAELFIHYGYDKTTVSDIAQTAGVSKGAIYLHFDGKDALLEGLIIREMKIYAEKWLALLEKLRSYNPLLICFDVLSDFTTLIHGELPIL